MIHNSSKQFNPAKENQKMALWHEWWRWCAPLRSACARKRTFLWMCVVLIGFSVRQDLWGVTSMVRALGLTAHCYDRILDFFHSSALDVKVLAQLWAALLLKNHPGLVRFNGMPVLPGDGIKVPKSGKKNARRKTAASIFRVQYKAILYPGTFVPGGGDTGSRYAKCRLYPANCQNS